MPRPKKMSRREDEAIDEASEALLDSMTEQGRRAEKKAASSDSPFFDEDGDLLVVPTMEELSILLDSGISAETIPHKEILLRNLKVTLRAIEMAELAYHANPKQGTATALTQMQNMAKDLLEAIESQKDPKALQEAILEAAIKPLVLEFIKVLTSEAERKRAALMSVVPPESAGTVTHEMKDLLKGASQGLDEAYDECSRKLEELLGAKIKK